jgi:Ca2+-binding EF-hand superfamily protein
MNRMTRLAFVLLSLAGSTAAFAHEPGNVSDDPACVEKRAGFRDKKLARFDTNHDGVLDEKERAAMRASWKERREERVARFDANHDGVLDDNERAAMRRAFQQRIFTKLDVNGDGQLSVDEVKCTRLAGRFAQIDTDKSGTISLAELQAAPAPMGRRHHRG